MARPRRSKGGSGCCGPRCLLPLAGLAALGGLMLRTMWRVELAVPQEEPGHQRQPGPHLSPAAQRPLRRPHWKHPGRRGPQCLSPARALSHWKRKVPGSDLELMRAFSGKQAAVECRLQGGALVFSLDPRNVLHASGHAYDISFPDYIVADEPGRSTRSTLQLFAVTGRGRGTVHPLGPAHSPHRTITEKGDGAFSHWRHAITTGPYASVGIRFSTPGNIPPRKLKGLLAVVFPMAPPMGWIEFTKGETRHHQEVFRELFLLTFPSVGVEPELVDEPEQVQNGTRYLWRVGGGGEFELPLKAGELYEKRLPYQIAEFFNKFEKRGGILFPPPESYVFYQNKVALAKLFQEVGVKTPATWVFSNLQDAMKRAKQVKFPVVIKDPYGYSSLGIQQAANYDEFVPAMKRFFAAALPGVEAIVQAKVVALREARVTYVDGRPFHGYWRIRQSLKSASAASNLGGYQDFNFPLEEIAPFVEKFAKMTGVPVGGVDFIWQEEHPDVKKEPFTLEVSPTSDINPPAPASWTKTYAEFKHTSGYHDMYLGVRRKWTELMAIAVIDQYRTSRRHLFVDIDNVVSLSAARVLRLQGSKKAYSAHEVMQDEVVPDAVSALKELQSLFFIRFLTARGQYEDCFNVTFSWLEKKGFEYDDLIVVKDPQSKVAHLTHESLLVDDFTVGHETPKPRENSGFMGQLRQAGLPFVKFPLGGLWASVLPALRKEARMPKGA